MGSIIAKGVVNRKPGYLYYVDGKGNVCEAKMARGGKKKKVAKKVVKKKKRSASFNLFHFCFYFNLFYFSANAESYMWMRKSLGGEF